ncbi:MAG: hypothetical protein IH991_03275, partial [Planctomycetes bacterium]|nr:hypothetical protein [Planctomycetota bacterium]
MMTWDQAFLRDFPVRLINLSSMGHTVAEFLEHSLSDIREALHAKCVVVKRGTKGRWRTVCLSGDRVVPPVDLLADALDHEQFVHDAEWFVAQNNLDWPVYAWNSGTDEVLSRTVAGWNLDEPHLDRAGGHVAILANNGGC